MRKPRLLDLCCGAGGAAMGYYRAGFDVVGVDIRPQLRYPFSFILDDVLRCDLKGFDAYHASVPCQRFTRMLGFHPEARVKHPDLIKPIRERLEETGKPY